MRFVLDTHAAIWLVQDSPSLGLRARATLADLAPADLCISDVTLSELARLLRSPALQFTGDPLLILESFAQRFHVHPVNSWIAHRAASYDWTHRDPADRHILATAEFLGFPLITTDATITPFAVTLGVKIIW